MFHTIIKGPVIGARSSSLTLLSRKDRNILLQNGYSFNPSYLNAYSSATYSSVSKPTSFIAVPDYLSLVASGYNVDLNALFNYSKNIHDA